MKKIYLPQYKGGKKITKYKEPARKLTASSNRSNTLRKTIRNIANAITYPGREAVETLMQTDMGQNLKKNVKGRARVAAYNNISPFGYSGEYHKEGIIGAVKDFINPTWHASQVDPEHPKWEEREIDKNSPTNYYRKQAWKKAMRQGDEGKDLYIDNGDGTYSYNMALIEQMEGAEKAREKQAQVGKYRDEDGYLDPITGNGGHVSINNGYMTDTWDLQPFKDNKFNLAPGITKYVPGLKNLEAVSLVGGNAFKLKQKIDG